MANANVVLRRLETELNRLEALMESPVSASRRASADAYERRLRRIDNQVRLIREDLEHLKASMT